MENVFISECKDLRNLNPIHDQIKFIPVKCRAGVIDGIGFETAPFTDMAQLFRLSPVQGKSKTGLFIIFSHGLLKAVLLQPIG
jgi:hypothetical protein